MKKYHLRRQILTPLTAAIVILLILLILNTYYYQHKHIVSDTMQRLRSVESLMAVQLENDANILSAALDAMRGNKELQRAFKARDRAALLRIAQPLGRHLKAHHGITHFYFTRPDRVCILRLYAPEKYGDRINRFTTVQAERTGKLAYGLELGRLGNLTLRVVEPWYEGTRLLGFVELGIEIQYIAMRLHEILGVEIAVFIEKKRLDRSEWEAGMKMLGRPYNWDQFASEVMVLETSGIFSDRLSAGAFRGPGVYSQYGNEIVCDGFRYRCAAYPIKDAAGSIVGKMVIIRDTTALTRSLHANMLLLSTIFVLVGGAAFALCFMYTGKLERELVSSSEEIERLAVTDHLTGLYNRRGFITLAEQQLRAAERTGQSLSLLFADLDDMKSINDGLGHIIGDQALVEAAEILREVFRKGDILARIGGDEFVVLAAGVADNSSDVLRSRLQVRIDEHNGHENRDYRISMSFGIVRAEQGMDIDALMARADDLMYEEKRRGRL